MRKIRLGKSGLKASELGFGGIPVIRLETDEAAGVIRHCYESGITFFDTANVYGDSEKKIGKALESVRGQVVFATKTLARDAQTATEHIAYSLENLRTDHIDLYQIHNIANDETLETVMAPGGAYEALAKARSEGKLRCIGFSSHNIATAVKACRGGRFDTLQFPFNFIERDPAEELFQAAAEMDMGIIGMKPLGGGLLERADLCFRFLQQYSSVVPIPGIQAKQEVDEIISLYRSRRPLNEEDLRDIEGIRAELGTRFCHRCEYCMPCEKGVMIPSVFSFKSMYRRLAPEAAIAMAHAAMESVESCAECGECIEKCPYDLPIPDLLKENLALYNEYVKRA